MLFAYPNLGTVLSPFLLLDYAGPLEFSPTDTRRGVGEHPHRGFETVTIVYAGEVEHRDSSGGEGHIGPGDVQWMTAASGWSMKSCMVATSRNAVACSKWCSCG
jgi:quercetin 2,3-dioxygenase